MSIPPLHKAQALQETQYDFPYHYLPALKKRGFRQHAYWSWGFRYLGGIHAAKALCDEEPFNSLIDLGCGDGRFLSELAERGGSNKFVGLDYSERAVKLARAIRPDLDYRVVNLLEEADPLEGEHFDVVTLIEVIEHIPPAELDRFVAMAVGFLRPGGRLVLTVPHKNRPVKRKHFQHFDSETLLKLLAPHLDDIRFQPLDRPSILLNVWYRLLGGSGRWYLLTWPALLRHFYNFYLQRCLYAEDESKCGRIALVGRRPTIRRSPGTH